MNTDFWMGFAAGVWLLVCIFVILTVSDVVQRVNRVHRIEKFINNLGK